jgi:hypothetical protein
MKINEQRTKYMIPAEDFQRRANYGFWRQKFLSRQRICVFGSSCDTEEQCGLGETAKTQTANRCFCGL